VENGIYFDLSEEEYHKIPALSASGIKQLNISGLDFWMSSWMNPRRKPKETEFLTIGTAYDTRIISGRQAFAAKYAPLLDPSDFPKALKTADDIKARLKELGAKVGGNKPELIARLLEWDPNADIFDVLLDQHQQAHTGKTFLPVDRIEQIEIAAAMIEKHPQLGRLFQGGAAQVSVVWQEDAVRMKCRKDYLKPRVIVDLKSFSNPLEKPINQAIASAMATRKYHVQAAVYCRARQKMLKHIARGKVFGKPPPGLLDGITAAGDDFTFVFVWQQTVVPVSKGKILSRNSMTFDAGRTSYHQALQKFLAYSSAFGTDPWLDTSPIEEFSDEDFPSYILED